MFGLPLSSFYSNSLTNSYGPSFSNELFCSGLFHSMMDNKRKTHDSIASPTKKFSHQSTNCLKRKSSFDIESLLDMKNSANRPAHEGNLNDDEDTEDISSDDGQNSFRAAPNRTFSHLSSMKNFEFTSQNPLNKTDLTPSSSSESEHSSYRQSTTKSIGNVHHRFEQKSKPKRIRTIFTPEQLERLESEFDKQQYMVGNERFYLATTLDLTEAQVKVWFQNRRIKWRRQALDDQQQRLTNVVTEKVERSMVQKTTNQFVDIDQCSDSNE